MTFAELITIIKDIVLVGVSIASVCIAFKGLETWKRQSKGQTEFELARRILITLFKYRDAIDNIRHPVIWAYEMPRPSEDEAKSMSQKQIRLGLRKLKRV